MLRLGVVLAVIALPMMAQAVTLHEGKQWRNCDADDQCIAIQGKCDLTSVHIDWKDEAAAYYRQEGAKVSCPAQFWRPKAQLVRCRLGQCETYAKPAASSKK